MSWSARNTSPVDLDTTILLREEEDRTGFELGWDAAPPTRQRKMINCRKSIRFTRGMLRDEMKNCLGNQNSNPLRREMTK